MRGPATYPASPRVGYRRKEGSLAHFVYHVGPHIRHAGEKEKLRSYFLSKPTSLRIVNVSATKSTSLLHCAVVAALHSCRRRRSDRGEGERHPAPRRRAAIRDCCAGVDVEQVPLQWRACRQGRRGGERCCFG